MKNLLNCHSIGLHSFPISFDGQLYRRVFYADEDHNLWKDNPLEIAIHPHHVDIKITVLHGTLYNCLYVKDDDGEDWGRFIYESVLLNGQGGFKNIGTEKISLKSKVPYTNNQSFFMNACELHTVFVEKSEKCVWIVEEEKPTCEYFPVNYSNADLTKWSPEGLYIEVTDTVKWFLLNPYKSLIT